MSDTEQWPLRRGSLIYPSPVAIACGRVLRARTAADRVNAVLKAAEVLTRYLAAVAVSSYATREGDGEAKLSKLQGNLSFGHFLTTVQEVAASKVQHPVAPLMAQGFKKTKRDKETVRGKTDAALVQLLELRNDLGHDLRNLDEAKAVAIEAKDSPCSCLIRALEGVEELLKRPLFVVENQEWTRDAIVMRRLLLMGESADPTPQSIKIDRTAGVESTRTPYVAINQSCLSLPPSLLWGIDQVRQNFALLFLDGVEEGRARYTTLDGTEQDQNGKLVEAIRTLFSGDRRLAETVTLLDGRNLAGEWSQIREHIVESGRRHEGFVDWLTFDQPTLGWFAGLLDPAGASAPHTTIRERLLDGRSHVEPDELRQLRLLFGRPAMVRSDLQRDVLDLRVIDPESLRPSKRDLVESANILDALKRAIRFFAAQTGMGEVAPEDLKKTEGSLDYLTLREVFVNQMVHQDYKDPRAAGQIEIQPNRVTVFNAGYSLVAPDKLLEGGKSQARNPLIARALRSIGFAEISGSGIRAVHRACQQAQRKAPVFESDREANTFTLTLDWSEGTEDVDTYWHTLIGVQLTPQQAMVLNAIVAAPSVTIGVIEDATRLDTQAVVDALNFLVLQVLVEPDESNFRLADHLRKRLG